MFLFELILSIYPYFDFVVVVTNDNRITAANPGNASTALLPFGRRIHSIQMSPYLAGVRSTMAAAVI
jgi:hypothetical protein